MDPNINKPFPQFPIGCRVMGYWVGLIQGNVIKSEWTPHGYIYDLDNEKDRRISETLLRLFNDEIYRVALLKWEEYHGICKAGSKVFHELVTMMRL